MSERVVQRCLCDNSLVPILTRTFIYDNGACMTNKGYDFAIRRLTQHLHEHYRKNGTEGYILLYDFSKFFDNISHEVVKKVIRKEISDERLLKILDHFIDAFGDIGLGLGSQVSQVLSLATANRFDHFVKERLHIRGYGRYSDDGYLIHSSKEYLKECLRQIRTICNELGITINEKKTQIVKLTHGFTWLKVRFFITEKGRIVKKICKRNVTKARQKLKKMQEKWLSGIMPLQDIRAMAVSQRAYMKKFDAYHTICNYDDRIIQFYASDAQHLEQKVICNRPPATEENQRSYHWLNFENSNQHTVEQLEQNSNQDRHEYAQYQIWPRNCGQRAQLDLLVRMQHHYEKSSRNGTNGTDGNILSST